MFVNFADIVLRGLHSKSGHDGLAGMPLVSTEVDVCPAHGQIDRDSCSRDITAGGLRVAHQGTTIKPHEDAPSPTSITHGWSTVTVNGRPIGCQGARTSCPHAIVQSGCATVNVGPVSR